jgi:hypothetical protein
LGTGLWRINLRKYEPQTPIAAAHNVYELRNTRALVNCLHKAIFSPTRAAFLKAVKQGHLTTWPGLTEDAINKKLKMIPATAMGHMNQKRQNILHIHSDASYLSVSHAGSRLGGFFYCVDKPPNADKLNGSNLNSASVIKNAVVLAA